MLGVITDGRFWAGVIVTLIVGWLWMRYQSTQQGQ